MDPSSSTSPLSYELMETTIAINWYQMMTIDLIWILFAGGIIITALIWRNKITELFK